MVRETKQDASAIGMIELNSVAAGIATADVMVKRADVELLECRPVCPGKLIILVGGLTQPVNEAMEAAAERGTEAVIDTLLLPNVHRSVFPALTGSVEAPEVQALGIVETISVASCIVAGDASAKSANVLLTEMRLANGLGGKSFYLMVGDVYSVKEGVEAAVETIRETGMIVRFEIIESLSEQVRRKVIC